MINPINITAAALITQLLLIIIMFVGAIIIRNSSNRVHSEPIWNLSGMPWKIITLSLITISCLAFSEEFTNIWKPLFGSSTFFSIKSSNAVLIMFLTDILWVSILVGGTGGSQKSPFSPIFFILPALAIFLRESFTRIIIYSIMISFFFLIGIVTSLIKDEEPPRRFTGAYAFVSIACFILTTYVAYITRPI
jgi:hypothetical protein